MEVEKLGPLEDYLHLMDPSLKKQEDLDLEKGKHVLRNLNSIENMGYLIEECDDLIAQSSN